MTFTTLTTHTTHLADALNHGTSPHTNSTTPISNASGTSPHTKISTRSNSVNLANSANSANPTSRPTSRPTLNLGQLEALGVRTLRSQMNHNKLQYQDLADFFGAWGPKPGSTTALVGGTSLTHAFLAAHTQQRQWCAILGLPHFHALAASERGVDLDYLLFVPHPDVHWAQVARITLDVCAFVLVNVPQQASFTHARRLQARVRSRHHQLVVMGNVRSFQPDTTIRVTQHTWSGLDHGEGRLNSPHLAVEVKHRGERPVIVRAS